MRLRTRGVLDNVKEEIADEIIDLQVDMIAMAMATGMACDLTRFATLFIFNCDGVGTGELTQAEDMHKHGGPPVPSWGDGQRAQLPTARV